MCRGLRSKSMLKAYVVEPLCEHIKPFIWLFTMQAVQQKGENKCKRKSSKKKLEKMANALIESRLMCSVCIV